MTVMKPVVVIFGCGHVCIDIPRYPYMGNVLLMDGFERCCLCRAAGRWNSCVSHNYEVIT